MIRSMKKSLALFLSFAMFLATFAIDGVAAYAVEITKVTVSPTELSSDGGEVAVTVAAWDFQEGGDTVYYEVKYRPADDITATQEVLVERTPFDISETNKTFNVTLPKNETGQDLQYSVALYPTATAPNATKTGKCIVKAGEGGGGGDVPPAETFSITGWSASQTEIPSDGGTVTVNITGTKLGDMKEYNIWCYRNGEKVSNPYPENLQVAADGKSATVTVKVPANTAETPCEYALSHEGYGVETCKSDILFTVAGKPAPFDIKSVVTSANEVASTGDVVSVTITGIGLKANDVIEFKTLSPAGGDVQLMNYICKGDGTSIIFDAEFPANKSGDPITYMLIYTQTDTGTPMSVGCDITVLSTAAELQKQVAELNKEIGELNTQVTNLENTIADLEKQGEADAATINQMKKDADAMKAQIASLNKQVADLENEKTGITEAKDKEINELKNEVLKLKLDGVYLAPVAKAANYNTITVSWNKNENADGYVLYSREGNGDWVKAESVITEDTEQTFTGLKTGTAYSYKLVAVKGDVEGSESAVVTATPKLAKAAAPTVKAGVKKVTASWKAVAGASGYQLSVAVTRTGTKIVKTGNVKKFTKKSLKAKKTYYVKVRAYRTVGGVKKFGAWSAVKAVKTK